MKVKKFNADTAREAMRQVRESLGPEAVILSNRQVAGGVEIMALASADISCLMSTPGQEAESIKSSLPDAAVRSGDTGQTPQGAVTEPMAQSIISEIQNMRGMLEGQLSSLAWGDLHRREPAKAEVLRSMLGAGFSPALSRQLLEKMPIGHDQNQGLDWAKNILTHNLRMAAGDDIVDKGGIYALVGPTGVGKTTTTAKLAARCVVRHGADKVVLLTNDSYRIGGHEQLRIYGKLLSVPVRTIKDSEDLQLTLSELSGKHLVLIDTVGMGQRDQMVAEQVAMLCDCGFDVKRLLLLNATSNGGTLDDVVQAYMGSGLSGCIITKVDEAASLGMVLDTIIRRRLALYFVTNGQKVPEDLHQTNSQYLLQRAFKKTQANSPFALQDAEFALVMAGNGEIGSAAPSTKVGSHLSGQS